jgi:hypothetical protein
MDFENAESKIKFILAVSALLTLYYSFHGLLESDPKASASVVQVQKDVNRLEKRLDKAVDREYKRWEMDHDRRNNNTNKRSPSTTLPESAKQQSFEAKKGNFF